MSDERDAGGTPPGSAKVVDLVDAGVPADQGLSALGLLMQLVGNLLSAYAALVALMVLLVPSRGASNLWVILILAASVSRSLFHRAAGASLLYGDRSGEPTDRLAAVRRYIAFALIHTAGTALIAKLALSFSTQMTISLALGLAVWPIVLHVLFALPRFRKFGTEIPLAEDKGFEAAAILMTVLGLCGLIGTLTMLAFLLAMPSHVIMQGVNVLVLLTLLMLVARSALHIHAGISGLRETSLDRAIERANSYANFGVISSFCAGGAMLLVSMSAINVFAIAVVGGMGWMLVSWPMIVRRFFGERQFDALLAGNDAPIHRRAPDAGLTGLGWLVFGHAMFSASFLLPTVVASWFGSSYGLDDFGALDKLFTLGGALNFHSIYWNVGLVALQAIAGLSLIRMTSNAKWLATAYGVLDFAVTIFLYWPLLREIRENHSMAGSDMIVLGPLAFALVIPIATLVLVHRKIAPTARARFRPRPTPASPPSS